MKQTITFNHYGEKVFLRKSLLGWRVIHPIKDPKTKKINWFNLIIGGWDNLLFILFIVFMTLTFYYVYWNDTHEMQKVIEDPCSYCKTEDMRQVLNQRLTPVKPKSLLEYTIKAGEQE